MILLLLYHVHQTIKTITLSCHRTFPLFFANEEGKPAKNNNVSLLFE